jgi:hypothetical protein
MRPRASISILVVFFLTCAIGLSGCNSRTTVESAPRPEQSTPSAAEIEKLSAKADKAACQSIKVLDENFTGWQLQPFYDIQDTRHESAHGEYSNVEYALDEFVTALQTYSMGLPWPDDGTAEMFTTLSALLVSCKEAGVLIDGS